MNILLHSKVEGTGKPLVILHGFFGMSDNWKSISSQLATQNYQVHLLDLRNHGRSFHSDAFSYELMVQDVIAYANQQQWQSYAVIGHSMGGKVAMQLACTDARVEKLVIADIGPKYYPPHHQTILQALNAVDFSQKPNRSQVEETLGNYINDIGVRQFLLKNLYWQTPDTLAFRFNLKILTEKVEEVGKALATELSYHQPSLFIYGKNSNYLLPNDMPQIQKQFSKAEFVGIEGAGHWLHAEKPTEFLQAVTNFLQNS